MELRNLRSFITVAETGSFSVAAARCYLTQSAISQHIKALEEELDCKLLIRGTREITLTESGEALLPRAKEILKQTEDCKEHINAINNCFTGELRIGVGSFIAPYIRKAAVVFMERYPNVLLNVEFGKACRLNQMLRAHQIDMAFTMNDAYKDEGIDSEAAIPFTISAIMARNHPLAQLDKVTFKDLLRHRVMMPDVGNRVFETVQRYVKDNLASLDVRAVVNNADEMLQVLEETRMITFLPKMYLQNRPNLTARGIVGIDELMSNAHWMKDVPVKRAAQMFLEIVREEAVPYVAALEQTL